MLSNLSWLVLSQPQSEQSGSYCDSHLLSSSPLPLPVFLPTGSHLLSSSLRHKTSVHLSNLPFLVCPMPTVLSHTGQCPSPVNQYLQLPASKLESILVLAPSSLLLLSNAGKLLSTGNFKLLDSS